jgi:lytic murein transglycosylase
MRRAILLSGALVFSTVAALAQPVTSPQAPPPVRCEPPAGFAAWRDDFRRYAVAEGVSQRTVAAALEGVTPNRQVLSLDRNQSPFRATFDSWVKERIDPRMARARTRLRQNATLLQRIEREYGVPGPILVAIWGMETDFGTVTGNMRVIRSLATLAHDCRRSAMFQNELLSALKIVDRGDLPLASLRGAWAGEIGQTQFLASNYERYAVDFDGDGRRDLIGSVPDVLASTANLLKSHGWRRGEAWDEGTANFAVLREWNRAQIYQRAIALFANRLAGTSSQSSR